MKMITLDVSSVEKPMVHCPACGQAILDMEGGDYSVVVGTCPHFLGCWADEPDDFDYMAPDLKSAYDAAQEARNPEGQDEPEDEDEDWDFGGNWEVFAGLVPESSTTFVLEMGTWCSGCGGGGVTFRLAFDFARTAPEAGPEEPTKG